jgi:cell division protein ZapA
MPTVEISVNGRQHVVQCGPGEENRTRQLASYVDRRIADMARGQVQAGDARLLVLATLKIADELSDAYDEIKRLRADLEGQGGGPDRAAAAGALEQAARQIDAIAAALESA